MTRRRAFFWMLACWIALTLTLTSIPNPAWALKVRCEDKMAHFAFYGVLAMLYALWRREGGESARKAALGALLFVVAFGAFDELHQRFIPGRSMEFLDWVADVGGGLLGSLGASVIPSFLPILSDDCA